jgi:hypothetical protein
MSPKYTFIAVSMLIILGALAGWAVGGIWGRAHREKI